MKLFYFTVDGASVSFSIPFKINGTIIKGDPSVGLLSFLCKKEYENWTESKEVDEETREERKQRPLLTCNSVIVGQLKSKSVIVDFTKN